MRITFMLGGRGLAAARPMELAKATSRRYWCCMIFSRSKVGSRLVAMVKSSEALRSKMTANVKVYELIIYKSVVRPLRQTQAEALPVQQIQNPVSHGCSNSQPVLRTKEEDQSCRLVGIKVTPLMVTSALHTEAMPRGVGRSLILEPEEQDHHSIMCTIWLGMLPTSSVSAACDGTATCISLILTEPSGQGYHQTQCKLKSLWICLPVSSTSYLQHFPLELLTLRANVHTLFHVRLHT